MHVGPFIRRSRLKKNTEHSDDLQVLNKLNFNFLQTVMCKSQFADFNFAQLNFLQLTIAVILCIILFAPS